MLIDVEAQLVETAAGSGIGRSSQGGAGLLIVLVHIDPGSIAQPAIDCRETSMHCALASAQPTSEKEKEKGRKASKLSTYQAMAAVPFTRTRLPCPDLRYRKFGFVEPFHASAIAMQQQCKAMTRPEKPKLQRLSTPIMPWRKHRDPLLVQPCIYWRCGQVYHASCIGFIATK